MLPSVRPSVTRCVHALSRVQSLLVIRDASAFTFCAWVPTGLNATPPSASAPPRDPDFFGAESSTLLRLRPSLLVCRSYRALAEAARRAPPGAPPGAPPHHHRPMPPSKPSSPSRSTVLGLAASANGTVAVPADQRYVYFNNRRVGRRGIGLGGSLRSFRLFVDASLESGTGCTSCATFAEGTLASSDAFSIEGVEVWGCGGQAALAAQEAWKEEQSDARKRQLRRALVGDGDGDGDGDGCVGVLGGAAKEDAWILGLLGLFSGAARLAQGARDS